MEDESATGTATVKWWEELERYKKENWCCRTLKEGAFEENLKCEFEFTLPVRFSVNYCCQCGDPVREGFEPNNDKDEDWCCRLMRSIGFEWIEFHSARNEVSTMRVNHCFHCGKELPKNQLVKIRTCKGGGDSC